MINLLPSSSNNNDMLLNGGVQHILEERFSTKIPDSYLDLSIHRVAFYNSTLH